MDIDIDSDDHFQTIMHTLDVDKNGRVELNELNAWVTSNCTEEDAAAKKRGIKRARFGCLTGWVAFCATGCPCLKSKGSNSDNVAAGTFAALLFRVTGALCCRQRFKKYFKPRGRWTTDPTFSATYGAWFETLTYSGRWFGMFPLYKLMLQVSIIVFFPIDWVITQLMALLAVEAPVLTIIYGHNACNVPIYINAGEQMLVTAGCYIQVVFLLVPVSAVMTKSEPNGSLLIYITMLAIVVQVLVISMKTYTMVMSMRKKKRKTEQLKLDAEHMKMQNRNASDLAELESDRAEIESDRAESDRVNSVKHLDQMDLSSDDEGALLPVKIKEQPSAALPTIKFEEMSGSQKLTKMRAQNQQSSHGSIVIS